LREQSVAIAGQRAIRRFEPIEHKQRRDWEILDILGAEGLLHREAGDAPMNAMHEENARESVVHTIYGGATEVMRNMVAERKLGFPRIRHDK
jgi:alkylation response protein AidB-like acyl-CoA dehydrogenase